MAHGGNIVQFPECREIKHAQTVDTRPISLIFRTGLGTRLKPAVNMHLADKENIHLNILVLGSMAELEQFRRGLYTLRFSVLMESYPFLFKQLFLILLLLISSKICFMLTTQCLGSQKRGIISARFDRYSI